MQNVETKIEGTKLTIVVDLSKNLGPSKSGKTTIVASSKGNVEVAPDVLMGINVYKKS
jgi:hypothetical protein